MQLFNLFSPRKKSHYKALHAKLHKRHLDTQTKLVTKHQEALVWLAKVLSPDQIKAGALGALLLFSLPFHLPHPVHLTLAKEEDTMQDIDKNIFFISDLSHILPSTVQPLTPDEEKKVTEMLSSTFGMKVTGEFSSIRLERNYGFIGAEQHLARFPGDTISDHFDSQEDKRLFASSGIAPGLGAWGYFAQSKSQLTEKDTQREKYYIAVQTFLSPGYNDHVKEYSEFFKYKKMLVINPNNGKAIVTVIADAGPSESTGKHLGGSPEVMHYLERVDGAQKGAVLYFFIDDPHDTIPLGPIEVQ